ncbi:spore germination protein [Alicyclobacillus curvatus]|nr:spore germination protein [Alicyclobacillus curvatus]
MKLPKWLSSMFTVDDTIITTQFSLVENQDTGSQGASDSSSSAESTGAESKGDAESDRPESHRDTDGSRDGRNRDGRNRDGDRPLRAEESEADEREMVQPQRPIPIHEYVRKSEEQAAQKKATLSPDDPVIPWHIKDVRARLNQSFHLPDNKDIVVRDFEIGIKRTWHATLVFVDGLVNTMLINTNLLEPLMVLSHLDDGHETGARMEIILETLLPSNQISVVDKWEEAVAGVLTGSTVLFVEGAEVAVICESKGWEHRTVSTPQTENVVQGPHQAFTENFRANTGLVRSMLRTPDLITETMSIGRLGKTDVAIMYIHGLTNKRLVEEIRRRIKAVDVDYLADVGILSQFIEDNPRVWVPQTLSTERPDRVAQMLTEGYVAVFVGQSSFVLVCPVVIFSLMQAAEDAYLRFPFGSFLRMIRWVALAAALMMPALYVSVTNYHPEMIPTDLMMAIAGSREQVPFPVIVEILLMEMAIELIREAGIRIPSIIGPTIGIVGALIIGQAAVQAGVVSPLLVIVIAVTALASFTIPNYNLQFGIRIMRFAFMFVSALFGFYGLTLAIVVMLARLTIQQSLGVPLFTPAAPKVDSSRDAFLRAPAFTMNQRPLFLYPQKLQKQQPYTRPWSGVTGSDPILQTESGQQDEGDGGANSDGGSSRGGSNREKSSGGNGPNGGGRDGRGNGRNGGGRDGRGNGNGRGNGRGNGDR